ncbi:MAG: hypothetical protein ACM3PY_03080, partial [Omnitrophica WOR_2 bacterium]
MSNPVIENVRRSLGRRPGTPPGKRPEIYPARPAGSYNSEVECFLNEVNKLSGVGKRQTGAGLDEALKALVADQEIRKATAWDTPLLSRLDITGRLARLGVEIVSPAVD